MHTRALVREQAFEKLRNAIITGQLAPGKRLIEREICEALGISRTSVREALRRVEAEKLAKFVPQSGMTVALLSRKEIIEIYEVRASLEPIIFQRFTEIASDNEVIMLRKLFNSHPEFMSAGDDQQAIFNKVIQWTNGLNSSMGYVMDVVNHEVIRSILRQLIARISVLRARAFTQPGRLEQIITETNAVLEAIESRRPKEAAERARSYVHNARHAALEMLNLKDADLSSGLMRSEKAPTTKN